MADSAVRGEWEGPHPAPGDSKIPFDGEGVVAVHAVLLHTGKVLMWNGRYEDADLLFAAWTWDPETGAESPALPFDGEEMTNKAWKDDKDVDLFSRTMSCWKTAGSWHSVAAGAAMRRVDFSQGMRECLFSTRTTVRMGVGRSTDE